MVYSNTSLLVAILLLVEWKDIIRFLSLVRTWRNKCLWLKCDWIVIQSIGLLTGIIFFISMQIWWMQFILRQCWQNAPCLCEGKRLADTEKIQRIHHFDFKSVIEVGFMHELVNNSLLLFTNTTKPSISHWWALLQKNDRNKRNNCKK